MKTMRKLILLLALLLPVPVVAADMYASTTGTNSGNCQTIGSPCLTINYARQQLSGTGTLFLCIGACDGSGTGSFTENVAAANWPDNMSLQAYAGETVTVLGYIHLYGANAVNIRNLTLNAQGTANGGLTFSGTTNVLVEDVTITLADGDCVQSANNGGVNDNITFRRVIFANCGAVNGMFAVHGIYLSKSAVGADEHWLFEDFKVYGNDTDSNSFGIHVYSAGTDDIGEVIFRRGIIRNNSAGLLFADCSGCRGENLLIYDNTGGGAVLGLFGGNRPGMALYNSTIVGNNICVDWGSTTVTVKNIICRANTTTNGFAAGGGGTLVQSDNNCSTSCEANTNPLFVNEAGRDLHLTASSPDIANGITISGITTDYDGVTRANPPARGAYEGSGAAPPPPPPPPQGLTPPTGLQSSCAADATTVSLSWNAVPTATSYYLRVNRSTNTTGVLDHNVDLYPNTTWTGVIVPGATYNWWVHGAALSVIGPSAAASFTCTAVVVPPPPPPPPTDPCVTNPMRTPTNIKWPSARTGTRSLTWSSETTEIIGHDHRWPVGGNQSVKFIDARGCSVTVNK